MKSKKLISLLCAAALTVSSFAGLSITASAAAGDPVWSWDGSTLLTDATNKEIVTDTNGEYLQITATNNTTMYKEELPAEVKALSDDYVIDFDTAIHAGNGMGRLNHYAQVAFATAALGSTNTDTQKYGTTYAEAVNAALGDENGQFDMEKAGTKRTFSKDDNAGVGYQSDIAVSLTSRVELLNKWIVNYDGSAAPTLEDGDVQTEADTWYRVRTEVKSGTATITIKNAADETVWTGTKTASTSALSQLAVLANRGDGNFYSDKLPAAGPAKIMLDNINIYSGVATAPALTVDGLRGEGKGKEWGNPEEYAGAAPMLNAPQTADDVKKISFETDTIGSKVELGTDAAVAPLSVGDGLGELAVGNRSTGVDNPISYASIVSVIGGSKAAKLFGGQYAHAGRTPRFHMANSAIDTDKTNVLGFSVYLSKNTSGGTPKLWLVDADKEGALTNNSADAAAYWTGVFGVLADAEIGDNYKFGGNFNRGIELSSEEWHTVVVAIDGNGKYRIFVDGDYKDPEKSDGVLAKVTAETLHYGGTAYAAANLPVLAIENSGASSGHAVALIDNVIQYTVPEISLANLPTVGDAEVENHKVTIEQNGQKVTVKNADEEATAEDSFSGVLIHAALNADKTVKSVKTYNLTEITTEGVETTVDDTIAAGDKLYVWNSLKGMVPYGSAVGQGETPAPTTYTVTITADEHITNVKLGTKEGTKSNNVFTFTEVAAGTYNFDVTYADGYEKADASPTSITVSESKTSETIASKQTVVAPTQYTITYDAAQNGTFTVTAGQDNVASGSKVDENTVITITPSASNGYELDKITVNSQALAEGTTTFTVTGDSTIAVTFKQKPADAKTYTLSATNTTEFTSSKATGASIAANDTITLSPADDSDSKITAVTSVPADAFTITDGVATYTAPSDAASLVDVTVSAVTVTKNQHTVSLKTGTDSAVRIAKGSGAAGTSAIEDAVKGDTITVSLDAGATNKSITAVKYKEAGDEEATVVNAVSGAYTITVGTKNIEIEVEVETELQNHDVTVDVTGRGVVTVDKTEAKSGETVTVTVYNDAYHTLGDLKANTTDIDKETKTFTMPDEDVEVSATFTEEFPEAFTKTVTEDFDGDTQSLFSLITSDNSDYQYFEADPATKNQKTTGKIYGVGSRGGDTGTQTGELEIVDNAYVQFDTRIDACYQGKSSNVAILGAPQKSNWLDSNYKILYITVATPADNGNGWIDTVKVNGNIDITEKTKISDGQNNAESGGKGGQKRDTTGWLRVSAAIDFTAKKSQVIITRISDGSVILAQDVPFADQAAAELGTIYMAGGKSYGAAWIDDVTIKGKPAPESYAITKADTENGSFTVDQTKARAGATVTISTTPAAGKVVDAVTVTGASGAVDTTALTDADAGKYTFEMPAEAVEVAVTFKTAPAATIEIGGGQDTVTKGDTTAAFTATVKDAKDVDITADKTVAWGVESADEKVETENLKSGTTVSSDGKLTVASDETATKLKVTATVDGVIGKSGDINVSSVATYTAAVAEGITGGTVEIANEVKTNPADTAINLTVTPDTGYAVTKVTYVTATALENDADAEGTEVTDSGDGYSFQMPADNVTVKATFAKVNYKVEKAAEAMTNGDITLAANTTAQYGDVVTLTVVPEAGYDYDTITVTGKDGTTVKVTGTKFTMPAQDVTVTATFKTEEMFYSAVLTHTNDATFGDAKNSAKGLDADTFYYNNSGTSGWAGEGYVQFTGIKSGDVANAVLTINGNQGGRYAWNTDVYYLPDNPDLTKLDKSNVYQGTKTKVTTVSITNGTIANKEIDVTAAVKAMAAEGKDTVTFLLTGNGGSATLTGSGLANSEEPIAGAPALTVAKGRTVTFNAVSKADTETPLTSYTVTVKKGETEIAPTAEGGHTFMLEAETEYTYTVQPTGDDDAAYNYVEGTYTTTKAASQTVTTQHEARTFKVTVGSMPGYAQIYTTTDGTESTLSTQPVAQIDYKGDVVKVGDGTAAPTAEGLNATNSTWLETDIASGSTKHYAVKKNGYTTKFFDTTNMTADMTLTLTSADINTTVAGENVIWYEDGDYASKFSDGTDGVFGGLHYRTGQFSWQNSKAVGTFNTESISGAWAEGETKHYKFTMKLAGPKSTQSNANATTGNGIKDGADKSLGTFTINSSESKVTGVTLTAGTTTSEKFEDVTNLANFYLDIEVNGDAVTMTVHNADNSITHSIEGTVAGAGIVKSINTANTIRCRLGATAFSITKLD